MRHTYQMALSTLTEEMQETAQKIASLIHNTIVIARIETGALQFFREDQITTEEVVYRTS